MCNFVDIFVCFQFSNCKRQPDKTFLSIVFCPSLMFMYLNISEIRKKTLSTLYIILQNVNVLGIVYTYIQGVR
jgi:hypothetical protein